MRQRRSRAILSGVLWVMFSIIIMQFNVRSATTVGIIVGTQVEGWNWVWYAFGAFLIVGGVVALVYPARTFLSIANILGSLFAFIGIIGIMEAFMTREGNEFWWLSLAAGILMVIVALWLGGQFLFETAETRLIFAGIWALMRGIADIIIAFQIKKLGSIVAGS